MTRAEVQAEFRGYVLALNDFEVLKTMSRSERKARARKYRDTALEIAEPLVIPTAGQWLVQSNSRPTTFHTVWWDGEIWQCQCYAFKIDNNTCRHIEAVKKFRGETGE